MAKGRLEARITVPSGGWTLTISENAGARSATVTIASASAEYYLSSPGTVADTDLLKEIGDKLTANATLTGTYTASLSSTAGKVTIASDGDDFAITWPEASLRDLLGWDDNITESAATYTSDNHAESLWLPDGDWVTEYGDIAGWWESDKHDVESASGYGWSYAGSKKRLNRIFWPAISRAKTLAAKESSENESFEVFWRDGIYGEQEWATVGGPIRWYPDTSAVDDTVYFTYRCHGLETFRPGQLQENWVGKYQIELPRLVQVPGEYPAVGDSELSEEVGVGIPTSIADIYDSADPRQSLINGLENSTTPTIAKPDYMWMGNGASGAVEVSGSGFDLTASTVDQEQPSTNMGAGNFSIFDNNLDSLLNTANGALQPGSGSFALAFLGDITTVGSTYGLFGDRDANSPFPGWAVLITASAWQFITDAGATQTTSAVAVAPSTGPCVLIVAFDATAAESHISTPDGDNTATSAVVQANQTTQSFGIGRFTALYAAARMEFGALGYWQGANAEAIAAAISTYRGNLATNLGFA